MPERRFVFTMKGSGLTYFARNLLLEGEAGQVVTVGADEVAAVALAEYAEPASRGAAGAAGKPGALATPGEGDPGPAQVPADEAQAG